MSLGLLGKKIKMTQQFNNNGELIPITLISCGPCFITKILTQTNIGYNGIQLGYLKIKNNNNIHNNLVQYKFLKEYKTSLYNKFLINQKITTNIFNIGDKININGFSIGKGFTGNIKRNNFSRGPMSHGSKHHRLQGSLGAGTDPARVFPGKKMSGRHGMLRCTIKNIEIVFINKQNNIIFIKGSIPGKKDNLINLINSKYN